MWLEYLYAFWHNVIATLLAAIKQWVGMFKDRKESPQEG
jgi:hypothetical protein